MSLHAPSAVVLSSFLLALIAGCATSPHDPGGAGQGGAITGAGGYSAGSTASSSASASSASGAGAGGGGSGGGGGQGGEPCANTDPGEPNNTEATAYNLGSLGCSDTSPPQLYGVIASADDTDWFVYSGKELFSCLVNPTSGVEVTTGIARVCAYFECVGGAATSIGNCPTGTDSGMSPEGRPGCCGTTAFTVDLNCEGTTIDESFVYLRVDDPTLAACTEYTLTFHY
jgi:hypothetical protein